MPETLTRMPNEQIGTRRKEFFVLSEFSGGKKNALTERMINGITLTSGMIDVSASRYARCQNYTGGIIFFPSRTWTRLFPITPIVSSPKSCRLQPPGPVFPG